MLRQLTAISTAVLIAGCGNQASSDTVNVAAPANEVGADMVSPANEAAPGASVAADQYVARASASDLYEIEAARLAIEKAERPEVKELARMILADHQRSTEALTAAARQATPPLTVGPQLDAAKQANMDALRAASGAAFDTEYLRQQVAAHEEALALVEPYAQGGEVAQLREHASTVAGPIRQHLERARALASGN